MSGIKLEDTGSQEVGRIIGMRFASRLRQLLSALLSWAGKRDYLLVRRYDRVSDGQGIIRRLHQESFCRLLSLFPAEKYEQIGLGRRGGA